MEAAPVRLLMTADAVGGVWQYATDLAAALVPQGFATTLAVLGPAPDAAQRQAAAAIPGLDLVVTGLPLDWLSDAEGTRQAAQGIAELARRSGAEIVHLNSPALAADASFAAPLVGVAHGCVGTWWRAARPGEPLDPGLAWHEALMARGLHACDALIAPTAAYAACVRAHYCLATAPHAVYNGRATVAQSPLPQHDCAFTAGRLWDAVKDTATLDAAAAMLPFPVHAAGSLTAPHGGTVRVDHLHLLGQLDGAALARHFAARPVFVSTALFEPFGLAVLEAAAAGCPLVLSDIATFRELWDGAAVFVPPRDARGFADAILECVEDIALRAELGAAARARAARYSVERMARATAAQYRTLLSARLAA